MLAPALVKPFASTWPRAHEVDFYRPVHAVLGLPVDAVTLHAAQAKIYSTVAARHSCFLSTPNLNFAINCLSDADFRSSVINSDLSLADGMPLLWVARLFGMPMPERVTGSGLFERLQRHPERMLSVYLFGGNDGAASAAEKKINAEPSGLHCVGHWSPGFGSVDAMSSEAIINDINNSHADFLLVALGAKKGQAWIERNRARLSVPLTSHLGAVINFAGGGIRRAPQWMQTLGLEWLWRIREEPHLWRRYWHDGLVLLRLLLTRVLPGALYQRWHTPRRAALLNAWVSFSGTSSRPCIAAHGAWCESNLIRMRRSLEKIARCDVGVELDLRDTSYVDSAFIGLLMLMHGHQSQRSLAFVIGGVSPALRRTFRFHCAEFLLQNNRATTAIQDNNTHPWRQKTAAGS